MKKDYVYQDKDQYKLLQNATKIGSLYVGDQGIVPAERVLPEQRFAHQPIFRRPPEEVGALFSYRSLTNGSIRVANKLKKKTLEAGVDLEYTFKGGRGYSFILKNWNAEAKAVPSYPGGPLIGDSMEGDSLWNFHWPVFFKDYVWFVEGDAPAVFYSKIKSNGYETKEIKVAFQSPNEQHPVYAIYFIYKDTEQDAFGNQKTVYKMVVDMQTGGRYVYSQDPEGWRVEMVQYKADSLEGPWVYEKKWGTDLDQIYWTWDEEAQMYRSYTGEPSDTVWDSFVLEFASLILSKSHNQLSLAVGEWGRDNMLEDVLTQVYSPPFIRFGRWGYIQSRGREGEIAIVPPKPPGYINAVKYLVKRLGNGQIQKTFITRLAWPEWVPS